MTKKRIIYRKKNKKKRVIKRILLIFFLLLVGVGSYAAYVGYSAISAANESYSELERGEKSKFRDEAVTVNKDPFSILLMGIEDYSSGGANGRTDSLIVATLNPKEQSIKLLSIPRDTEVELAFKGTRDKINHAYAYGGKEETIETVENFLNIPIDYYATVNFNGFKEIIDEIGGVTVDVPFDFWEKSDVDNHKIYFTEGQMKLNGEEALAYARMRKQDPRGDFGRNDRQKQIIIAAVKSILSPKNLLKVDDIAEHIGENVETNMKISEGLGLQSQFENFSSITIEQLSIEGSDEYINSTYYFIPNKEKLSKLTTELQNHLSYSLN